MEPRPHYFTVGIFVLLMLSLGVVLVVWFSKIDLITNRNYYAIYFEGSVTGLRENEEVKFRGVPIGKVYKITVDKINVDKVRVLVNIERPELIREDAVATIDIQGLTGYTFVQIRGSTKGSPILKVKPGQKYPVIKSKPSEIQSLFAETPLIMENLNRVVKKLNNFLSEETIKEMQQTVINLKLITEDLSKGPNSLKNIMTDLQKSFHSVEEAATHFASASKQIDLIFQENRHAIHEFTQSGLPQLTRFIEKARTTVESIGQVAEDLEQGPGHFLGKNRVEGYKIE